MSKMKQIRSGFKGMAAGRILMILPTAVFVALISFSTLYFSPGNAAEAILRYKNPNGGPSGEMVALYEKKLEIDNSFPVLFLRWLKGVLSGDLGSSFKSGLPVAGEFFSRFPCTLLLILSATVIYLILGFTMGILAARFKDSILDHLIRLLAVLNLSIPNFWLSLFLLWIFSMRLKILPAFGYSGFSSLLLPAVALGTGIAGTMSRVIRTCVLEASGSPYALTARAKGLKESSVLIRHILINILMPVITLSGINTVGLIGSTAVIENIFGLPGVGSYLIQAIELKDFPVISGFVFLIGIVIIMINLIVDFSYFLIDPRVRNARNEKAA